MSETRGETTPAAFTLNPDIRFRRVGDEAVVLAQDAGEVLVLNEVGARVLELIEGKTPIRDWSALLLEEYDVEAQTLEADIARYTRELQDKGVIRPVRTSGRQDVRS
jgi:hypothetical protein